MNNQSTLQKSIEQFFFFLLLVSIKQKRQNYGIQEFALRAFDGDTVVGRFDNQQTGNLVLKYHTCSNGVANVGIVVCVCATQVLIDVSFRLFMSIRRNLAVIEKFH